MDLNLLKALTQKKNDCNNLQRKRKREKNKLDTVDKKRRKKNNSISKNGGSDNDCVQKEDKVNLESIFKEDMSIDFKMLKQTSKIFDIAQKKMDLVFQNIFFSKCDIYESYGKNTKINSCNQQNSTFNKKSNKNSNAKIKISEELSGRKLLESMFKELANDKKEWMDHQISIYLLANKIVLPLIHKCEWQLNKTQILKEYGIDYVPNGLVINIPRQLGKTEAVTRLLAQWLKDLSGGIGDPFTILAPGIQKSTFQEFIDRTYNHLIQMDLSKFSNVHRTKSEIILEKGNDVRKMQGFCINSNVSSFFLHVASMFL